MATRPQFRKQDVSAVPRGHRVRTVAYPSGHRVRIAFPPGPRRKGSGKLVSILHPKGENPRTCTNQGIATLILATPIEELLAAKALSSQPSAISNPKEKTREQVVKMQAKAVRFLRNVVGDSDKADEIEGLSVAEYAARKRIQIANPRGARCQVSGVSRKSNRHKAKAKRRNRSRKSQLTNHKSPIRKRRKNQAGEASAAAEAYRTFHGEEPKEILEFQQEIIRRKDYAALGALKEIEVSNNGARFVLEFPDKSPLLAQNASGRQLYVIGGDQDLTELLDELPDKSKDFLKIGQVNKLTYRARKDFDRFEEIDYHHKMGEGGHEKPDLNYDKLNRQMYFVGGEYQVKREGIVH